MSGLRVGNELNGKSRVRTMRSQCPISALAVYVKCVCFNNVRSNPLVL